MCWVRECWYTISKLGLKVEKRVCRTSREDGNWTWFPVTSRPFAPRACIPVDVVNKNIFQFVGTGLHPWNSYTRKQLRFCPLRRCYLPVSLEESPSVRCCSARWMWQIGSDSHQLPRRLLPPQAVPATIFRSGVSRKLDLLSNDFSQEYFNRKQNSEKRFFIRLTT